MKPVLFEIGSLSVNSYGFLIMLGAFAGIAFVYFQTRKKYGVTIDTANELLISLLLAAIVGGKLFFYFEKPSYFIENPDKLFENFGNGFVFYGSFLFAVPTMIIFFRKKKLPLMPMLDIMALTTCIVHVFGRMGCFLAGCCYGKPTNGIIGVTFTEEASKAEPLHTALHPTQLYSATMIIIIFIILWRVYKYKTFHGQIILLYTMLYAIGRSIIEIFRGDIARGFIIEDIISHSQFIAMLVFLVSLLLYLRLRKNPKLRVNAS